MVDRPSIGVGDEIALADIRNVTFILVFGEKVIKGLVAARADIFRDGFPPFFAVCKDRIDIEDHAAEIEHPVADDIADTKSCAGLARRNDCAPCLI